MSRSGPRIYNRKTEQLARYIGADGAAVVWQSSSSNDIKIKFKSATHDRLRILQIKNVLFNELCGLSLSDIIIL